jgi:hypothetical protein
MISAFRLELPETPFPFHPLPRVYNEHTFLRGTARTHHVQANRKRCTSDLPPNSPWSYRRMAVLRLTGCEVDRASVLCRIYAKYIVSNINHAPWRQQTKRTCRLLMRQDTGKVNAITRRHEKREQITAITRRNRS